MAGEREARVREAVVGTAVKDVAAAEAEEAAVKAAVAETARARAHSTPTVPAPTRPAVAARGRRQQAQRTRMATARMVVTIPRIGTAVGPHGLTGLVRGPVLPTVPVRGRDPGRGPDLARPLLPAAAIVVAEIGDAREDVVVVVGEEEVTAVPVEVVTWTRITDVPTAALTLAVGLTVDSQSTCSATSSCTDICV